MQYFDWNYGNFQCFNYLLNNFVGNGLSLSNDIVENCVEFGKILFIDGLISNV